MKIRNIKARASFRAKPVKNIRSYAGIGIRDSGRVRKCHSCKDGRIIRSHYNNLVFCSLCGKEFRTRL